MFEVGVFFSFPASCKTQRMMSLELKTTWSYQAATAEMAQANVF